MGWVGGGGEGREDGRIEESKEAHLTTHAMYVYDTKVVKCPFPFQNYLPGWLIHNQDLGLLQQCPSNGNSGEKDYCIVNLHASTQTCTHAHCHTTHTLDIKQAHQWEGTGSCKMAIVVLYNAHQHHAERW